MLRVTRPVRLRLALLVGAALLGLVPLATSAATTAVDKAASIPPFEVVKIGAKTWVGRFGPSNCAWIDLGTGVFLFDTGASPADTANLQAEIKKTTGGKAVKWIVLSHMHEHANGGFPAFAAGAPTVYVRSVIAPSIQAALNRLSKSGTPAKVVGVQESAVLTEGGQTVKVFAPKGGAATGIDLWAFSTDGRVAFLGDLITAGRCPALDDPDADPVAWSLELGKVGAEKPLLVVGSTGDAAKDTEGELATTRAYLERIYRVAKETRDKGLPEARVSSQLAAVEKVGEYCSTKIDVANGLAIYRRLGADGVLRRGAPEGPARPRP
jgi:glyoxylase-like metal-dependent hydrolase (beta-lactamase superfamily II)